MRKFPSITLLIISLLIISQFLFALPEIVTTKVCQVGPGVVHKRLEAPSKPWIINVLEMNIQDTSLRLRAIDGGGLQKPSVMASAKETTNYRLVGTTNGDFYEPDYTTTNAGVVDGKMTKLEKLSDSNPVYWSALSIDDKKMPTISCNKFEGQVIIGENSYEIHDVNSGRSTDELVFFNQYAGNSTDTYGGREMRIRPVNGWLVNDTMCCVMESISSSGDMSINTSTAVLSGDGAASSFLANNYLNGDTIKVLLMMRAFEDLSISGVSYNYLPLVKPLKHLVGGYPMFVRNGVNYALDGYRNENGGGSFATDLHPRTAIGYNQDTTKLYMVVVDGRQTSSIGISLVDLADIMIDLGAWRAMNFDGGGSSVMVVDDNVVTSPSDGVERSVRNCVAIYSTAPEGELSMAQIELDTMKLYRQQSFDFSVSGWDDNYNPKTISNWGSVTLSCDTSLGTISGSNGNYTFTASRNGVQGFVYAKLDGNITDSMYVEPTEIDPMIIVPGNAVTDTIRMIQFSVKGINNEGDTIEVPNEVLDFSVKDLNIGTISEEGIFTGKYPGTTMLYVNYGSQCDSTEVSVYVGDGECSIDMIESIEGWSISGSNLDSAGTFISTVTRSDAANGNVAMKINYKTVDSGKLYLEKEIEINGVPDTIMLDVLSDGLNHRLYINLEDAVGDIYTVYQSGYINNAENYETRYMDVKGIDPVFPIKVKNIYIRLRTGVQEGFIYIDDLRMSYPNNTSIDQNDQNTITPEDFILHAAYPNPFNPSVSIPFELHRDADVKLSIFNLRGEMVELLTDAYCNTGSYEIEWNPSSLSSACYFYKLEVGNESKVGKMLYLK